MADYPDAGTIFDLLGAHGISWANYHNVPALQINMRRIFRSAGMNVFRIIGAVLSSIFPALLKSVQSKVQATADLYPLGTLRSINHLRTMRQFFADAKSGSLPAVTIVDPDFGQWSEENPQDIQAGEAFSAKVINAVMSGKGWPGTVLFWLYDEHGGYYDHVAPPPAPEPDGEPGQNPMKRFWWLRLLLRFTPYPKQIDAADSGPSTYDRFGFRVPAVVISPFAKRNFVDHTITDQSSIIGFVEDNWGLPHIPNSMDSIAGPITNMLDFSHSHGDEGNGALFLDPSTGQPAHGRGRGRGND